VIKLAVTLRCAVCGPVPCATWAEADKRAERHMDLTGHPTAVEVRNDGEDEEAERG
jgi:hypothetical protein